LIPSLYYDVPSSSADINIHVKDLVDADAVSLDSVFELFSPTQRVHGITQRHGGTLDLLVTSEDTSDVSVAVDLPCVISDHALVVADLPIRPVRVCPTPQVVRGWRSVDRVALTESVASSPLGRVPSVDTPADELFAEYDRVLR